MVPEPSILFPRMGSCNLSSGRRRIRLKHLSLVTRLRNCTVCFRAYLRGSDASLACNSPALRKSASAGKVRRCPSSALLDEALNGCLLQCRSGHDRMPSPWDNRESCLNSGVEQSRSLAGSRTTEILAWRPHYRVGRFSSPKQVDSESRAGSCDE
jgi:hypothetical protein